MLNQALRRTSGSNVHVDPGQPVLARPTPAGAASSPARARCWRTPGRMPVMWLCSDGWPSWSREEPERPADDLLAGVGRGDVPAGVLDGAQQLDARRAAWSMPHTWLNRVDDAAAVVAAAVRQADPSMPDARAAPTSLTLAHVHRPAGRRVAGRRSARPELGATAGRRRRRTPRGRRVRRQQDGEVHRRRTRRGRPATPDAAAR